MQFLRNIWPIHVTFLCLTVAVLFFLPEFCKILLYFIMIGPPDLLHPSPAPHFKTFELFLIISRSTQFLAPHKAMLHIQLSTSILFLKFFQFVGEKRLFLFKYRFCLRNSGSKFTCISRLFCYQSILIFASYVIAATIGCNILVQDSGQAGKKKLPACN